MSNTTFRTDDFDYHLPDKLIAQEPMEPRDACRLLVMNRSTGELDHRRFYDIGQYLRPGDLLVVNETRVLPARLKGKRVDTGGAVEVLLLKELDKESSTWECLVKPGKRVREGAVLGFSESESEFPLLTAKVVAVGEEGLRTIAFTANIGDFHDAIHKLGELPLPPYIKHYSGEQDMYQTVYAASEEHSAAAPTAGLHFTPELLDQLKANGINVAKIRLDVGLDTFRPVTEDDPTKHHIHTEYFHVPQETADAINRTHKQGGCVVAVGTTVVRALESAAVMSQKEDDTDDSGAGDRISLSEQGAPTSLYILPGFDFQVVDALITNFHVPRSTLVMMVSAFAERNNILAAYEAAVQQNYRFLSFGDAMLIL